MREIFGCEESPKKQTVKEGWFDDMNEPVLVLVKVVVECVLV